MSLEACLERLAAAIDAARVLGLPVSDAEAVHREAVERLGFPADVYVLALVGGTGVGKSSLLNALAGADVSPASVRRPTTDQPIAWVPAAARAELGPLLTWLDVRQVREHADEALGRVAVLDLPDMDSIEPAHRQRVEELLPRVDAVAWVTDPEKYHDAVLHDEFLRRWLPRLERQLLVVNKSDRLAEEDAERLRGDLARDVAAAGVAVAVTSARGGPAGLDELRGWLEAGVEAKSIVRARLAASVRAAIADLAAAAGLTADQPLVPLVAADARRQTLDRTAAEVMRAIDLPGLERQAVAATKARARSRGTGPIGMVLGLLYRTSGREARVADPAGFLVRWRERASLVRGIEALRSGVTDAVATAPPLLRPTLAAAAETAQVERLLARTIDGAVARAPAVVPSSRFWPVVGLLQTLVTALIVFAAAWLLLVVFVRVPVDTLAVPVIGQVPMPLALLTVSVVVGSLLTRLLGLHARWLARRWSRRLAADVRAAVESGVAADAFAGLDRLEAARRALWEAAAGARSDCAAGDLP